MAILLDDASSQYLVATGALAYGSTPMTFACWFRSNDGTIAQTIMSMANTLGFSEFSLRARGDLAGDPLQARAMDEVSEAVAATTTGYTANTWHHGCAVFDSSTSRTAYIDGANSANNTTSKTPSGINSFAIGRNNDQTPGAYVSGDVAEAAIWSATLTDAQVASLATGISPLLVRAENLENYWSILGNNSASGEIDVIARYALTWTGSPTKSAHPRMKYQHRRQARKMTTAAAAAGGMARLINGGLLQGGKLLGGGRVL